MLNRSDGFAASVVLGATLLAGCAGLGLGEAKTAPRQGSSFDTALANDYLQLSTDEYGEGDYRDSDTFAVASMVAGAGESPMPAEVNSRGLPADKVAELSAARTRLTSAMDKGASQKMPAETARAQVMFDCWMQEQEENWPFQKDQVADCRDGFLYAMEQVDAAPGNYLVFFDLNSASLTPEGTEIVQKAAMAPSDRRAAHIVATGHTDSSGSAIYNQDLSERRATAAKDALVLQGIPADSITTVGKGKTDPLVPTEDGVREPQNRRVEIKAAQEGRPCAGDKMLYCHSVDYGGGAVFNCMKANRAKLTPACATRFDAYAAQLNATKGACREDVMRYCTDAPLSSGETLADEGDPHLRAIGGGKILNCLIANESRISPVCRTEAQEIARYHKVG